MRTLLKFVDTATHYQEYLVLGVEPRTLEDSLDGCPV